MDDKSLEMLEFPKVREILAGFASFSASRHLALSLRPSSDAGLISVLLSQSAEARRLLSLQPDFSIGGAVDVREAVHLAARGKVLEPQALLDIQGTLASARHLRTSLEKLAGELPLLWGIAGQIVSLPHLEEAIGRSISPTGEILDSASPKLASLRGRLKGSQEQLLTRLEAIIKSPRGRKYLQAGYVAERDGRYVLPVKAECRKDIRGIVHDVSNTGATTFVEPWSTVELGNEVRELTIEERREVERILLELSVSAGANDEAISRDVDVIAELDLALSKARYAQRANAAEPRLASVPEVRRDGSDSEGGVLRLINARHPLLAGKAVPLSVEIGGDCSVLVITGPNTGGKTVALKTVGLLALMAQAGIPVPASEESCIPVFDRVFADIGDEQSIEHTLSTFSWHMGNIVRIIESSTGSSLVLLDELGTSTDPNEGAALARAVLRHFLDRGVMVVATTHYNELKVFAHTTPGMQNASLDFDAATLTPTYHLTVGIPGGSNALATATRLGLRPDIISDAKGMLARGTEDVEELLADLMSEKGRIESLRTELEIDKRAAENLQAQWRDEVERLKEQERSLLRDTRDRLAQEAADLQREVRRASAELKKARSQENIEQAEKALAAVRAQLKLLSSRSRSRRGDSSAESVAGERIRVGDKVWLPDVDMWGTVLSVREEEGQIEVQVGSTRLRMGLDEAERMKAPPPGALPKPPRVTRKLAATTVSIELDLRGKRADEVEPAVDRYLSDACLASLSRVRIIHGYGTGTVRQIVREMLASHSLVRSFRPGERGEGGDGVTVVEL